MWYEQESGDQNHAALTSQSLRAAIGPLQFSLRHWNLRNLTLQITRDFFRLQSTFARLYNAAASPASRLRSSGSLAIIIIIIIIMAGSIYFCAYHYYINQRI